MVMEINHFNHDHPLHLSDEIDGFGVPCNVCWNPIMGLTYFCKQCTFVVHKWCAELPREITIQHFDMKHNLILQQISMPSSASFICDMCHIDVLGYAFQCSDSGCAFITHVECGWSRSMKDIDFVYEIRGKNCRFDYNWPVPELDPLYRCSACGKSGSGPRLECDEFDNIVIHIQCAQLPTTVKHVTHCHTLALTTVTDVIENEEDEFICNACEEKRNPKYWVYHCPEAECDIRIHINCGIFPAPAQHNWSERLVHFLRTSQLYDHEGIKNIRRRNWIRFQRRAYKYYDGFDKINQKFAEAKRKHEKRKEDRSTERNNNLVMHFYHKHPLEPFDEPFNPFGNHCFICRTSIYGKTYGCQECDYFLHKWCAGLQQRIQHPLHEHPLSLKPSDSHQWECGLCSSTEALCMCYTCDECNFNLEVLCAVLPGNLKHELHHEHILTPVRINLDPSSLECYSENITKEFGNLPSCNICGFPCENLSLECGKCNLHLHIHCFLLPSSGKHMSHRHELELSLPPDGFVDPNGDSDEFICDACEENRDPKNWVYKCMKCEDLFAAHVNCVVTSPKLMTSSMWAMVSDSI